MGWARWDSVLVQINIDNASFLARPLVIYCWFVCFFVIGSCWRHGSQIWNKLRRVICQAHVKPGWVDAYYRVGWWGALPQRFYFPPALDDVGEREKGRMREWEKFGMYRGRRSLAGGRHFFYTKNPQNSCFSYDYQWVHNLDDFLRLMEQRELNLIKHELEFRIFHKLSRRAV